MATYLDTILAVHRSKAIADSRDLDELRASASSCGPTRNFAKHLRGDELSVIAEIKRRSPSKGELGGNLDASTVAQEYERGGAAALSVLTDQEHFDGSVEDLVAARAAGTLPVLRKDFCVDERHIYDARIMGADAILLIVAALSDEELSRFAQIARDLEIAALVEVHDEREAARALESGAVIIGVNQRDLVSFEVDHERAVRVGASLPESVIKVAESGVRGPRDAVALRDVGFDAVLVGETLVTAPNREEAVRALRLPNAARTTAP